MNETGPDFGLLAIFAAVAEETSFSKVALKLCMARASV